MYLKWIIGVLEKGKTPASWVAPQWLWAVENVAHLHTGDAIATKMLLDRISARVERKLIEGQGGRDEVMSQAYLTIISAYDEGGTDRADQKSDQQAACPADASDNESMPDLVQSGQFCEKVTEELKQIRHMSSGRGWSMVEAKREYPNFAVWQVVDSLGEEDKSTFSRPNMWGPVVGYANGLLATHYGKDPETIKRWKKTYRTWRKSHPA